MRLVPLGTSSGQPTADRHVSGLAVDLGRRWVLVDCGEGTQQQIMRSPLAFKRLDTILLTHLHGDHVLGLPGLLGTLGLNGRREPLRLVAPLGVRSWLDAMLALPILGVDFPLEVTELDPSDAEDGPVDLPSVDGWTLRARLLRHRAPSFGYRFDEPDRAGEVDVAAARALGIEPGPALGRLQRGETVDGVTPDQVVGPPRPGRSIVVTGDTGFTPATVALAAHADVLVHECTYAADDHDLCVQWTHSCSVDVAQVVVQAGVQAVVLQHFSARYPEPERLAIEVRERVPADVAVHLAVEREPITF